MNTDHTIWLRVKEVKPKEGSFDAGYTNETKQTCKFVEILSEDEEYSGVYVIPVNGIERKIIKGRKDTWVRKEMILSMVEGVEFIDVIKTNNFQVSKMQSYNKGLPRLERI